ncbi:BLUF domain-containing protein [Thalassovita sp.]|uniref:BLUF domain-containing protein n=1 Tax=Thalassovita sp. TaxID=1979401 RepID=UPI002B274E26|nr:BLUF domain-containing protein [Thalassovita sp.]
MFQLLYSSKPLFNAGSRQDEEILRAALQHNIDQDITGFLLRDVSTFYQVLEGPEKSILGLFETIKRDSRHKDVQREGFWEIERRSFGHWAMGYRCLTSELVSCETLPESVGAKRGEAIRNSIIRIAKPGFSA